MARHVPGRAGGRAAPAARLVAGAQLGGGAAAAGAAPRARAAARALRGRLARARAQDPPRGAAQLVLLQM